MAVMKDVAERAGVSLTTVSFVLNGVARQHKVADTTVEKVCKAARELGYRVNDTKLNAPKVIIEKAKEKNIAIMLSTEGAWDDTLAFVEEAKKQITMSGDLYNVTLIPYEDGAIMDRLKAVDWNEIHSAIAIVGNDEDYRQLEENDVLYPLVIINRRMKKYSTIEFSSTETIRKAVALIKAKGYSRVTAVAGNGNHKLSDGLFDILISECQKADIIIAGENYITAENTLQGGAIAARRILNLKERPELILCMNTTLAYGMLSLLARNKVYIPHHAEFLCIGWESEIDYIRNYIPSLSMITVPVMEMSRLALQTANTLVDNPQMKKMHFKHDCTLILNESFSI